MDERRVAARFLPLASRLFQLLMNKRLEFRSLPLCTNALLRRSIFGESSYFQFYKFDVFFIVELNLVLMGEHARSHPVMEV